MTTRTLKGKLDRLAELQSEIDTLTAQADTIRDAIKKELEARNLDELEAGEHVVRWKPIISSRLDGKALKADMPELYTQYCKPTEARRFTLVPA